MKTSKFKKRNLLYILLPAVLLLSSCGTGNRTEKAHQWINDHPKPIVVLSHSLNGWTMNYRYTLIDSAGVVYYAGEIEGTLPDTINVYGR